MSKVQIYEGDRMTVTFDPVRCIHAGRCVHGLPDVFNANTRGPWVHPDAASADALAALIRTCPSGALSYRRRDGGKQEEKPACNVVTVTADGPLYVHAEMTMDGHAAVGYRAALCRCGASQNKPWCDNSHQGCGFSDDGMPQPETGLTEASVSGPLTISPLLDGPLEILGPLEIRNAAGQAVERCEETWLCRCGHSGHKPFCDGTHKRIGFSSGD